MVEARSSPPQRTGFGGTLIFILLMLFIRLVASAYFALINFTGDENTLGLLSLFNTENFSEVPMSRIMFILIEFLLAQIALYLDVFLFLKFIAKSRKWAAYFTAVSLINLLMFPLETVAARFLLDHWPDTTNIIVGNFAVSVGIIQYMLTSKRATSTFVN